MDTRKTEDFVNGMWDDSIVPELEEYIQKGLTVGSKLQVLIKAEEGVRHRDVARVSRAAGEADATVTYVAVLEER